MNKKDDVTKKKKRCWLKRYSSEIQAFCAIVSTVLVSVITIVFSVQSNRIAEAQLSVSKYELKPIVTFAYEQNISENIDRITVHNSGAVPLDYEIEVISFFDFLSNENLMGNIPIRVYTLNGVSSCNSTNGNNNIMAEIDVFNETYEFIGDIKSHINYITSQHTSLSWAALHTYVVKVECIDTFNENNEFYYRCNNWGGNVISVDEGREIFSEYKCMVPTDELGSNTSKERYFDLQDTNAISVFKYALNKMRELDLYVRDFSGNEVVTYGKYEPKEYKKPR